jgi:hypothetical protein
MMISLALRSAVLSLMLAAPFTISTASAQGKEDKDSKAVSAYTLTMPKYKKLMQAMLNLGKAAQKDSTLATAIEDSGNKSLDQMTAAYNAKPQIRNAIGAAGLTSREFAVGEMALLQAGMSYGLMKQYKMTADSVHKATGVSMANLEFYRANEAEIERLTKQMEAEMPKDRSSGEAGDSSGT